MFIRKCIKTDPVTGKKYFFYQLVESVRTERGPRQTTLLNLGADLSISREETKTLANRIEEIFSGISTFLEPSSHIELLAQKFARELIKKRSEVFQSEHTKKPIAVNSLVEVSETDFHTVDVNTLKHNQARTVGVETISHAIFEELELGKKLQECGFSSRQIEISEAVIIGRLAGPGNELATYDWLKTESGLDEVMNTNFQKLSLRKVYEVGDLLESKKEEIEEFLDHRERDLFNLQDRILLYDLTNTYFEGSAEKHAGAHRGKSKENRSDCPLITLGVVLNQAGFLKRSQIFDGNVSEPLTLKKVVQSLEKHSIIKPILVIDAGFSSEDNLEYLRTEKHPYIAVSRKRAHLPLTELDEIVKQDDDHIVKAKLVKNELTQETELHCHSEGRQLKEESIRTTFQKRFEDKLQKIADVVKKTAIDQKLKSNDPPIVSENSDNRTKVDKKMAKKNRKPAIRTRYDTIQRRIGRLCEKYRVISSYYDITVQANDQKEYATAVEWKCKEIKIKDRFDGCYVLRAYGVDLSAQELWKTYIMLTEVEDSFRSMKTDLNLRPIFHRKEKRINAHLFITVLAYHIMHTIRYKLRQHGLRFAWETIRKNMKTQVQVTTSVTTQEGKQLHIRGATEPEPFHKKIFRALNICSFSKSRKTLA